ncbi:MAG TPA: four-helix bundle copper-binding protein [Acidimicrobiales bacterium]|nr:four-helix bundle copper-binding protein [Acidimicrobiales bacterium]
MAKAKEMLETYPGTVNVDVDLLSGTIEALVECANTCTQCADACLAEGGLSPELAKCIRLDLDCADVCATTSRVVARQREYDANVTRSLLEACAAACKSCGDECEKHAAQMEHCRICAESCRRCEEACRELLAAMA